jgi:TetR/AcrR family transcriptional repressor of nem operon
MARPREFDEERVLSAALEVFWSKGYEATSVQDLTEHMGIRKASLYNTFGDKRALFTRALTAYQREALGWYRGLLERPGPARAAIAGLFAQFGTTTTTKKAESKGCFCVNTLVELAPTDRTIARMLHRHDAQVTALFAEALERGKRAGEFPRNLETTATARFLQNALTGISVARKSGADPARLADIVRVTLSVLGPP